MKADRDGTVFLIYLCITQFLEQSSVELGTSGRTLQTDASNASE